MSAPSTLIAAGTTVRGHVQGSEDLLLQGALQGTLLLHGALIVDDGARADATIEATSAVVHGIVVGRIVAADFIELGATARVLGDLTAPRVIIRDGAGFSGNLEAGDAQPGAATGAVAAPAAPAAKPTAPAGIPSRPTVSPPPARPIAPAPVASPFPTSRPVTAPAPIPRVVAPAPAPVAPPPPVVEAAPEPEDSPAPDGDFEDDEPELPDAAAKKQVSVKKRK